MESADLAVKASVAPNEKLGAMRIETESPIRPTESSVQRKILDKFFVNSYSVGESAEKILSFLKLLMRDIAPRDFAVRLWDGSTWDAESGQSARFTLVLNSPGALKRMLRPPSDISLGEAYAYGDFNIEGDFYACVARLGALGHRKLSLPMVLKYSMLPGDSASITPAQAAKLEGRSHTRERDKAAIRHHYDLSNAFYSLWLDERMLYSCAYYADERDTLETAQLRKLDHICRKLRLRPGQKLLDIGCGWGALIMHAAEHYGVEAYGITLSVEQAKLAQERIRARGLESRCRAEVRDYRDVLETFDAVSSIGMAEHVGTAMLQEYFQAIWNRLRPGGVCLNHAISLQEQHQPVSGPTFIKRYIFPDSELQPLGPTADAAEEAGFEVRDVESLREHYAMTLKEWLRRLEAREEQAIAVVGRERARMWRLYLAASAWFFESGKRTIYQTLLLKHQNKPSGLPLTRRDWYF